MNFAHLLEYIEPKPSKLTKILPWLLVIGGLAGLVFSLILTIDQIHIWQNPHYRPACNLNPVLSCGSVINSKQGHILGVPGPFYGLITFPVIITIGAALLAGARFKKWFWQGLAAGATLGAIYALWLFWVSLYKVHALCPFCLATDLVVYTLWWYVTLYSIDHKIIPGSRRLIKVERWLRKHHLDILGLWLLVIVVWILNHFWYYYGKQLF